MQRILRQRQLDSIMPERIVGVVTGNHVLGFSVALKMLFVNVLRHHPRRILGFAANGEVSDRGLPVEASEPDWKRVHHRGAGLLDMRMLLSGDKLGRCHATLERWHFALVMNRAGRRREIIVQPHLGDVQHDSDVRRLGQDMLVGQNDLPTGGRRPPIDGAVGVGNFLGRHAEPSPHIEQGVALLELISDQVADDVVLAVRQRVGEERTMLELVLSPSGVHNRNRHQRRENQGRNNSNRNIDEAFHQLPRSDFKVG